LCYNCRQPGHYIHNCPNLQHQDQNLGAAKCDHDLSHRERGTSQRSASRELCSRSRDGDGRVRHVVRGRNASWIVVPNFCYEYES
jgi:hypothetical protein